MNGSRGRDDGRRKTTIGLIGITVGTMLLMAWALFPTTAVANEQVTTPWTGNGSNNLPCNGTTLWILTGFGNQADEVVGNPVLTISGAGNFNMQPQGNGWRVFVNANLSAGISASASWVWDESDNSRPTPVLTISHCTGGTTSTTTPPSTSTTPPSTSTTPPSTSTTPPSTSTSTSTSSTSPPTTTSSSSTSVAPTTITPTESTSPPDTTEVNPTTISPPRGTAFTGVENVIPLGVIALTLMTTGSGLVWAGTRRSRKDQAD